MRSFSIPLRYFLAVVAAIAFIILIDYVTSGTLLVLANIGNTLLVALLIFILEQVSRLWSAGYRKRPHGGSALRS